MGSMSYSLSATPRTVTGRKVKSLLDQRQVPAVLYGFGTQNQILQVDASALRKVLIAAGENQVVELEIGKTKHNVLFRDVQIDPIRREIIHTDFYAIDVTKPVEVEVPLVFTGEAPAVKLTGGSLVKSLSSIKVRCLPKDFVKSIEVSVDSLATLEDAVSVKDLKIPASWTLLENPEDMVASVVPPKIETFDVKPADAEAAAIAAVNAPAPGEEAKPEAGKDAKKDGKKEEPKKDKK